MELCTLYNYKVAIYFYIDVIFNHWIRADHWRIETFHFINFSYRVFFLGFFVFFVWSKCWGLFKHKLPPLHSSHFFPITESAFCRGTLSFIFLLWPDRKWWFPWWLRGWGGGSLFERHLYDWQVKSLAQKPTCLPQRVHQNLH